MMKIPSLYDDQELERYLRIQQDKAWDLEKDFPWAGGIDLKKPFAALDKQAIFFPQASYQQRVMISQYLGLVVASIISEFEVILTRLKKAAWDIPSKKYPVNPELLALGEEFFVQEHKHSQAFERFIRIFAEEVNVSYEELLSTLPRFNYQYLDALYSVNAMFGGMGVWWMVAAVEEMSILIYLDLRKHQDELDPLYLTLHRRHFEEEARHASFAFLMLELLHSRNQKLHSRLLKKTDFMVNELVSINWLLGETVTCLPNILRLRKRHPFFRDLSRLFPLIMQHNPMQMVKDIFTTAPYVSLLMNPADYPQVSKSLKKHGVFNLFQNRRQTNELVSIFE
ncbi:MAG: diiron oxygenase [Candidatus Sericytochromatia bacterium]